MWPFKKDLPSILNGLQKTIDRLDNLHASHWRKIEANIASSKDLRDLASELDKEGGRLHNEREHVERVKNHLSSLVKV